jgi:hypothetical protein
MNDEPRSKGEYSPRQTEAARRVLIDLGQVVEFYNSPNAGEQQMQARRAYELVRKFLNLLNLR